MFYIYSKKNENTNSTFDRYFKSFNSAKECMLGEIESLKKVYGAAARCVRNTDRMNTEKGFYEFEQVWEIETLNGKETMSFAIIDGYFED